MIPSSINNQERSSNAIRSPRYVLITPAYNEAACIEQTIQSVVAQRVLPVKWVIVSDGSTDETDTIVNKYAPLWKFIEFVRVEKREGHNFASKVFAFNQGLDRLSGITFDFLGNLDGDVAFGPSYFVDLLHRFDEDPALGIAGGGIYEWDGSAYRARKGNTTSDVAGAVQLFRRACWDAVGGFLPLQYGGEDWCAQLTARMHNWRVQCFPELEVHHLRPSGNAAGLLRYWTRQGMMDYSLGSHPIFEMARLARRVHHSPFILGSTARLCGFLISHCRRETRPVPAEVVRFLQCEERERLRRIAEKVFWWRLPAGKPRPVDDPLSANLPQLNRK